MSLDLIAGRLVDATEAGQNQLFLLRSAVQRIGSLVAEAKRINAGTSSGGLTAGASVSSRGCTRARRGAKARLLPMRLALTGMGMRRNYA
jgi:hypothetical protein